MDKTRPDSTSLAGLPVLKRFAEVVDTNAYAPVPDDWTVGVSDVVGSTARIREGDYKAVNLAGAATISAVKNALSGDFELFIFAGDGARFVVPPHQAQRAADALARTAMWARRDLGLELRVGTATVAAARAAGYDIRAAYWQASPQIRYAVFVGGGLEWAESEMKAGRVGVAAASGDAEPDLTGLSCQWGPVESELGTILSLIVKPVAGRPSEEFADIAHAVIALLDRANCRNPVPDSGPEAKLSSAGLGHQARIAHRRWPRWLRYLRTLVGAPLMLTVFRLGMRLGGFDPLRYRREIFENSDFRKFDDGLMMTVDCPKDVADELERLLDEAQRNGIVRFGVSRQQEALVTCVVPSVLAADHMHFVDGASGGYAEASRRLQRSD